MTVLKKVLSIVVPILIGGLFLYLTFGEIDLSEFWFALRNVSFMHLLVLFAILLLQYLFRGWRWFLLLPRPHLPGEYRATLKSLVMGYAITQVLSRVGEVYRIWDLRTVTKREFGQITSTVFLERVLLDFTVFILLMLYVFAFFQDAVETHLPQAPLFMQIFVPITFGGLAGMALVAIKPHWVELICQRLGIFSIPVLGKILKSLFQDLVKGLEIIKSPAHYFELILVNALTWISAFAMTYYCLWAFGIEATLGEALFIFTLGTVGVLVPSPGGVGVFHYLVAAGTTALLGASEAHAVAFATVVHGVIMGGTVLLGCIFYFYKPVVIVPEGQPATAE